MTSDVTSEPVISVAGSHCSTSVKNWGVGGQQKFFGQKVLDKNTLEACKICHFSAKIIKFSLILTHLKLLWEANWGGGGGARKTTPSPMVPPSLGPDSQETFLKS